VGWAIGLVAAHEAKEHSTDGVHVLIGARVCRLVASLAHGKADSAGGGAQLRRHGRLSLMGWVWLGLGWRRCEAEGAVVCGLEQAAKEGLELSEGQTAIGVAVAQGKELCTALAARHGQPESRVESVAAPHVHVQGAVGGVGRMSKA
jgi:hypothetical protein